VIDTEVYGVVPNGLSGTHSSPSSPGLLGLSPESIKSIT
ncbi:hypothetical protein V490_01741, partial [Pseudogymnoascus sp. VKM F-3557]